MTVSGISGSSTSTSPAANSADAAGLADNFNTFLTLLTTQLQNQNPLDPLDTNQFTEQLVQFSGVEQQLKTNDYLSSLVGSNSNTVDSNAVNYIGKTVSASGVNSELVNNQATWNFNVPDAANVSVDIKDSTGKVVYSASSQVKAGSGTYTWDGRDSEGNIQPPGTYTIQATGVDSEGKTVPVSTQMSGTVTGVDFTGSEPVLLIGTARVNLSGVTTVSTPSS